VAARCARHRISRRPLQPTRFSRKIALQGVQIAHNDLQQIVEIVRHAARQLADGLHLLRLAQGLLVLAQLFGALAHLPLERGVELDECLLRPLPLLDFALHGLGEADVIDGDRGLRGESGQPTLGAVVEHACRGQRRDRRAPPRSGI
jgi:hypothetical protein